MPVEVSAALIAGTVSLIGFLISYIVTRQSLELQRELQNADQRAAEERLHKELNAKQSEWETTLLAQEQQWQESFRAELRRNLVQETTLRVTERRIQLYGEIWRILKITSRYEWRHLEKPQDSVQRLANQLGEAAFGEVGMLMSDRSRRLLYNLQSGCAQFLRGEIQSQEVIDRAHMLKHSLRGDLGIIDYEYESDLMAVAAQLGKVDDWQESHK